MSDPDARRTQSRDLTPEQQFWQLWRQGRPPELPDFLAARPGLTPAEVATVIAVDQYERWSTGERVTAEEYLKLVPQGKDRDQAVCDVIWGEYLLRDQLGEHPDADEYLARFPSQAELFARQLTVHQALADFPLIDDPAPSMDCTVVGRKPHPRPAIDLPDVPGYEVLAVIGQGGMGVVYQARQKSLDRIVALKVVAMPPGSGGDPAILDRKRREAKVTARLSHPNIVTVYDAGSFSSSFYLAMEYVPGIDLHRLLEQRGPMPIAEACDYVRQAALGLQHAYEQGLVHRDIKPSNLMIAGASEGAFGTLKILDLGLARLLPSHHPDQAALTHDGAFMGTPDFIAPEQANDPRAADIRSDLYSLGCTFYCMLSGQPPFQAATPLAKLVQHHLKDPAPIETLRREVPPGVAAILRKLLAKRPEDRYQTPAELAQALTSKPDARARAGFEPDARARVSPPLARASGSGLAGRLTGHADRVKRVAFSPDGRWLASASLDRTVRLWDVAGRSEAWCGRCPRSLSCLAFSPNGDTLVAGSEDRGAWAWDLPSRQLRWHVESDALLAVVFTPSGNHFLAACQDGTLRLRDATTGQEARAWQAHAGAIWGLANTPDGGAALSGGQDRSLRLWEMATGESLAIFPQQAMLVTCVAISPDGTRALSGGIDGTLHVWDLPRRRELGALEGHDARVTGIAFAPDGVRAVSASRDGSVRLWDVPRCRPLEVFGGHSRWVTCVDWSPTAPLLASGGIDRGICLWQVEP